MLWLTSIENIYIVVTVRIDKMVFAMAKNNSHPGHRDSRNGQFVTERHAKRHPDTTQRESIPNPGRGDTGRGKKR